jgi:hypothetical protein
MALMKAWGNAPGGNFQKTSAASANQFSLSLNPRRSARRTARRACSATRGTPPETLECDGALVAPQRIAERHRADSGSLKTRHIRAARKGRDTEHQEL